MSPFLAWGDFHARLRFARSRKDQFTVFRSLSLEKNGGLLVVLKKAEKHVEKNNGKVYLPDISFSLQNKLFSHENRPFIAPVKTKSFICLLFSSSL